MFNSSQLRTHAASVVAAVALAVSGGSANAAASLTSTATTQGFTLSTFVGSAPASGFCCGPIGLTNTTNGNIMVGDYGIGQIRVFSDVDGQVWTNGTAAATNYGANNVAGLTVLGSTFYGTRQANGQVITLDAAGNQLAVIANLSFATGIIGNAANNTVYVSNGTSIFALNPATNALTTFAANQPADGLAVSNDGSILYAALQTGHLVGFNTSTGTAVFDSGVIPGGIDGAAFGSGNLAGNVFVNTNDGRLIQVNLSTLAQTTLVSGGSRGDFVLVDANNGTLLFTQTDSVLRLIAPEGGGFGPSPVPEPETWSMLLAGFGIVGFMARRRKQTRA